MTKQKTNTGILSGEAAQNDGRGEVVNDGCWGLFHDGIEAVAEKFLAHGLCVPAVGEGADLDMDEIVLRLLARADVVAALPEGGEQNVRVLLMGDSGHLHNGRHSCDSGARRGHRRQG